MVNNIQGGLKRMAPLWYQNKTVFSNFTTHFMGYHFTKLLYSGQDYTEKSWFGRDLHSKSAGKFLKSHISIL